MHGYAALMLFLTDASKSSDLTETHAITAHEIFAKYRRLDRCENQLNFAAMDRLSINSLYRTAEQITLALTSWIRTSSRWNALTRAARKVESTEMWTLYQNFIHALRRDLRAVMATDLLRLFWLGPHWLASMDENPRKRLGDELVSEQVVAPKVEAATAAANFIPAATCLSTEQQAEALSSSLSRHREQWHMMSEDLRERVLRGARRTATCARARQRAHGIRRQLSPHAAVIMRGIIAAVVLIQSSLRRFLVRVRCAHCLRITAQIVFDDYLTASWRESVNLCISSNAVCVRRCQFSADFCEKILNKCLTCRMASQAEKSNITRTPAASEAAALRSSSNAVYSPESLHTTMNSARVIQAEVRRWQARCTLLEMRFAKFAAGGSVKGTNAMVLASSANIDERLSRVGKVRQRGRLAGHKVRADLLDIGKKQCRLQSTVHESILGRICSTRKISRSTKAALGNQSPKGLRMGTLRGSKTRWRLEEIHARKVLKVGKPNLMSPTRSKKVVVPWARPPTLECSKLKELVRRHRHHTALLAASSEAGLIIMDKKLPSRKKVLEVDEVPCLRICVSNVAQRDNCASHSSSRVRRSKLACRGNLADLCLSYHGALESRLAGEIQRERCRILELASQKTRAARSSLEKRHQSQRDHSRTAINRISHDHQVAIVLMLRDAGILR